MGDYLQLVPFLLMLLVMYLLVIRPQVKERQAHDDLVAGLSKDQEVVTQGGVHGKVVSVKDATVVLDVGKGVHVTVDKIAVQRRADQPAKVRA